MTTQELWQAALGDLELSLSKANFTTWFKQTFIISFQNNEVVLGVPNTFTKAWLEKKYHKAILVALQNLCPEPLKSVNYRVETRQHEPEVIVFSVKQPETQTHSTTPVQSISVPSYYQQAPQVDQTQHQGLNPRYFFSNFIVGKGNELAHAASQAVSQNPGNVYNPLFLYGGVGLGKTHLLQAIGHEILKKNSATQVLYVTCERFTNDFIHAVKNGKAKEFKDLYRNVDLLLMDDIQFLSGKKETQEEFFNTFNALHQQSRQIVLTSDRQPRAITDLEDRLISRFEWGMLADISSPDLETRIAILDTKCRERGYHLSTEILAEIAKTAQSNVRELEGALNKIFAFIQLQNITPTLESIKQLLTSFNSGTSSKFVSAKSLIEIVARYFDLNIVDLLGKSREKRLAFPRQIIMFLMREELKSSFPAIGQELGGRDHTTAMHACDKIKTELVTNERLKRDIENILQQVHVR
ncbi:MAG: chromosomal replication initiator protein DnaA [bacterium]